MAVKLQRIFQKHYQDFSYFTLSKTSTLMLHSNIHHTKRLITCAGCDTGLNLVSEHGLVYTKKLTEWFRTKILYPES